MDDDSSGRKRKREQPTIYVLNSRRVVKYDTWMVIVQVGKEKENNQLFSRVKLTKVL